MTRPRVTPGRAALGALALGVVVVAGAGALGVGAGDMRVVWSDEFDGGAGRLPGEDKWVMETIGQTSGNGELQCYTDQPDNAATDGKGHLVITAHEDVGHYCSDGSRNDFHLQPAQHVGEARLEARAVRDPGQGPGRGPHLARVLGARG